MYALKLDKISLDCMFEGILSGFDMLLPDRLDGKTALLDESDGTVRGFAYLKGVSCSIQSREDCTGTISTP
ncbi:MAG: hypothetical protein MJZ38_01695 [archaeon]|nr:hypothetical protein [archaeon]